MCVCVYVCESERQANTESEWSLIKITFRFEVIRRQFCLFDVFVELEWFIYFDDCNVQYAFLRFLPRLTVAFNLEQGLDHNMNQKVFNLKQWFQTFFRRTA